MKRIAASLGSLSLVLMQNGFAEPAEVVEHLSSATNGIREENAKETAPANAFSLNEMQELDLDEELLSLEQELSDDLIDEEDSFEENQTITLAQKELANALEELKNENVEADTVLSELSLESTHEPVASTQAEVVIESIETTSDAAEPQSLSAPLASAKFKEVNVQDSQNTLFADTSEAQMQKEIAQEPSSLIEEQAVPVTNAKKMEISLKQVFYGSPTIYITLAVLSVLSFALWLFNLLSLKRFANANDALIQTIRDRLVSNQFDEVLSICKQEGSFFAKIMGSGISSRKYGLQFMLESMKSEGKRATVSFWQRLNIIHDIAIIAPMIGLLGTVLGMFYAFYDLNRSFESISSLFDGLGVSVGTTVAGIFVAVLSMILHSVSKYRLVKSLTFVENEAVSLAHLIDSKKQQ